MKFTSVAVAALVAVPALALPAAEPEHIADIAPRQYAPTATVTVVVPAPGYATGVPAPIAGPGSYRPRRANPFTVVPDIIGDVVGNVADGIQNNIANAVSVLSKLAHFGPLLLTLYRWTLTGGSLFLFQAVAGSRSGAPGNAGQAQVSTTTTRPP